MPVGFRVLFVGVLAVLWGTANLGHAQDASLFRPTIDEQALADNEETISSKVTGDTEPEDVTRIPPRKLEADPYAPQGLGRGGLRFYPELGVSGVYTSNVDLQSQGGDEASGLQLKPALRFESDWVRHAWEGEASGTFDTYFKSESDDEADAAASTRFRLDIRRHTRAEFDARYDLTQSGAEDSELPATATSKRTEHDLAAGAALIHDFGGLEGRAKLGLDRQIFEDVRLSGGATEDNGDRNSYTPSIGLRVAYIDPPAVKPFVDVTYAPRFHDRRRDRNGLERDSHGVATSLGVMLDRGPIWSGEAALVYALRDYKDPALATNSAIGINGNLTWRPTDLTSAVLTLATDLNETSSAISSGSVTYSARMDVTHALRDNLSLEAGVGAAVDDDAGADDTTITSRLGLAWQLNPSWAWTASYDGTWLHSGTAGESYDEQRIATGIVLRH